MNFLQKLKEQFFKFNIAQQISVGVLALAVPLLIALSANAVSSSLAVINQPVDTTPPEISDTVVEEPEAEEEPQAEEEEEIEEEPEAEPVVITLKPASVEEDLEVQIVDQQGNLVVGYNFQLTVDRCIVVDNICNRVDQLDGQLSVTITSCCLCTENECSRIEIHFRMFFDFVIKVHYMKNVQ